MSDITWEAKSFVKAHLEWTFDSVIVELVGPSHHSLADVGLRRVWHARGGGRHRRGTGERPLSQDSGALLSRHHDSASAPRSHPRLGANPVRAALRWEGQRQTLYRRRSRAC